MKKAITALSAIVVLTACSPATGPGNKEPVNEEPNDPIEEQNYHGDDLNDMQDNMNPKDDNLNRNDNNMNRNDNNLNRRQFNDNQYQEDQAPNYLGPDIDGPNHMGGKYPNGDIVQ